MIKGEICTRWIAKSFLWIICCQIVPGFTSKLRSKFLFVLACSIMDFIVTFARHLPLARLFIFSRMSVAISFFSAMIAYSHSFLFSSIASLYQSFFEQIIVQGMACPSNKTVLLLFSAGGLLGGLSAMINVTTSGGVCLHHSFIKRSRVIHGKSGLESLINVWTKL